MKPLITILVTCFNKEKYISYVLNMLLEQNDDRIEVYIIDDKSTDSSRYVINACLNVCPDNFHIIMNDINKGTGSVRNQALDLINGEFFIFIDGDDLISETYVQDLIEAANNPLQKDIYIFQTRYYPLGEKVAFGFSLWDKLIRTSFIKNNNFRFKEGVRTAEDIDLFDNIGEKFDIASISYTYLKVLYYYNTLAENTITHDNPCWFYNLDEIRPR